MEHLRARLAEAEETLRATRAGEVDALLVAKPGGDQVFTLNGAEHGYRVLVEEMNEGAATLNRDGLILNSNGYLAGMLGTSLERVAGSALRGYIAEQSLSAFDEFLKRCRLDRCRSEVAIRKENGSMLPVLLSGCRVSLDGAGGISIVVTDLSMQKAAEETLRRGRDELEAEISRKTAELRSRHDELETRNEELRITQQQLEVSGRKYADPCDFASAGYFTLDPRGLIREVNLSGANLIGFNKRELQNKPFSLLIHDPGDMHAFSVHRRTVFLTQTAQTCDLELRRSDGSFFYARLESISSENVDDKAGNIRTAVSDITDRKRIERALIESEEKYRSLFDNMTSGFVLCEIITDDRGNPRDYRYLEINRSYEELSGIAKENIVGRTALEYNPSLEPYWLEKFGAVAGTGEPMQFEHYVAQSGTWLEVYTYSPGKDLFACIISDVTLRKRAEEALQKSEERLASILAGMTDAYIALDSEWRIREINPVAERDIFNRPSSELKGKVFWDLYPEGSDSIFHTQYQKAAHEQVPVHFEAQSNVTGKWLEVHAYPQKDRLDIYFRDITDRKRAKEKLLRVNEDLEACVQEHTADLARTITALQEQIIDRARAEEALRQSQVSLAKAQAIAHIGSWSFDLKTETITCSDELFRIFSLNPGEFDGDIESMVRRLSHPDDRERVRKMYRQILSSAKGEPLEYRIILPGGKERTVWAEAEMVFDRRGEPVSIVGTIQDISERKRVDEELIRLAAAVESAADALVVTDPAMGIIQYVNPAFEKITGHTREEVVGRDLHLLDSGKHDEKFYETLRHALRREGYWSGRLVQTRKDGTLYEEECTYSAVKNPAGDVINYIAIKRDVSEKTRLESIAQAIETMNNIGYIFSGVSHEIGNPINSIRLKLNMLKRKLNSLAKEKIGEHLDGMLAQVSRVEYLLAGLKNYSMYENLQPCTVEVSSFAETFLSMIKNDFESKGISIEFNQDAAISGMYADPRALQQVLLNVLTNASDAVEGRPDPKIVMDIHANGNMARIRIKDNGVGIKDGRMKDLFKPFYTTKERGTGLGLVITKKMITKMNGTVEIKSRVNQGTTVEISLPQAKSGRA